MVLSASCAGHTRTQSYTALHPNEEIIVGWWHQRSKPVGLKWVCGDECDLEKYICQVGPYFCINLAVHNFSTPFAMDSILHAKSVSMPNSSLPLPIGSQLSLFYAIKDTSSFPTLLPHTYIYMIIICRLHAWDGENITACMCSHQTCFAVHFPCRHSCKLWRMHMRENIVSSCCLICVFSVHLSVPLSMSYHFHLLCILTYSQFQSHEHVTAVLYNLLHQSCTLTAHINNLQLQITVACTCLA